MMPSHVLVGGGTAAVILAHQLLAAGHRVVLIEQASHVPSSGGKPARSFWQRLLSVHPPEAVWTFQSRSETEAEEVHTTPQRHEANRIVSYSAATRRGLGGNSNVNAMILSLGCEALFDAHWSRRWSAREIRRLESIVNALVPHTDMVTSGNMRALMTLAGDERESQIFTAYQATIDPATQTRFRLERLLTESEWLRDGQLRIEYESAVERVEVVDGAAVGVSVRGRDGSLREIRPEHGGEIVLCCGAFETPRLLHRSGVALPGVGHCLRDHPITPCIAVGNWFSNWRRLREEKDAYSHSPQYPLNGVHGWVFLDEDGLVLPRESKRIPSCQLLFVDGSIAPGTCDLLLPHYSDIYVYTYFLRPLLLSILKWLARLTLFQLICGHVHGILVCLVQPRSKGSMDLKANTIDPRFFSDPRDLEVMARGVATARNILERGRQQAGMWNVEVLPGWLFNFGRRMRDLESFVRHFSSTYFHPCGTCSMGDTSTNEMAVVNEDLQVKGLTNLRIADASIIPHIPNVPIAKMCMIIGAAAAERIIGKQSSQ